MIYWLLLLQRLTPHHVSAWREHLDHLFFWNEGDLEKKLEQFRTYYNNSRVHSSLDRSTPAEKAGEKISNVISIENYRWKSFAQDLFQLPLAA